jgi:hypothetical protein
MMEVGNYVAGGTKIIFKKVVKMNSSTDLSET